MTCTNCGKPINRGKWCSDKCRMVYKRIHKPEHKPEQIVPEQKPEQAISDNPNKCVCGDALPTTNLGRKPESKLELAMYNANGTPNEWFHSACHKTQAEIEAHYTLANFPPVKYGSGRGSLSPYPMSDSRYKAYV